MKGRFSPFPTNPFKRSLWAETERLAVHHYLLCHFLFRFLGCFSSHLQLFLLSLFLWCGPTCNASVLSFSPSLQSSKLHCIPLEITFLFLSSCLPLKASAFFVTLFPWSIFVLTVYLKPSFFSSFLHLTAAGFLTSCLQCVVILSHRWKAKLQGCRNPGLPHRSAAAKYRCPIPDQVGNLLMLFMGLEKYYFPQALK